MQSLTKLNNLRIEKDPRKIIVEWWAKIGFLKNQISKLEQLKDFPVFAVAAFLLKCQIIEFELKQIISSLDLHLYFQTESKHFKKRVRTPKDLDDLTLGKLVNAFNQFIRPSDPIVSIKLKDDKKDSQKDILNELKDILDEVVVKRNEFTHRLFSPGKDIQILIKEAESGINDTNKALELFKELEKEIKTYET
ncbi:hypothetical protein COU02_00185 [bacterium (Candidatus Gribaldobacteria) CG10_big_fil_rev_8_21_14_0_10_37_46]|uniref:RiboL-PSP-HEPN domain-containing protein n=1 Tax=bacterium (Candidatus Gribaldobacteria) CG10_big_fil_rev_8_21_14_0_10_37_46 TaxID=2014276 RepID=A0A2H0UXF8_9BACT|nr:MAG: hypothetical protein COU02_00185 [bacterium (Candidatus Gribaldobacteria) CG10_big_fil_rev_8_21_14_0_10_37_46]